MRPARIGLTLFVLLTACGGGAAATRDDDTTPPSEPASACPEGTVAQGREQGGLCLDESVLGEQRAAACGAELERERWVRDEEATAIIGQQTGRPVRCYHVP
jgi:hypothetical protein